MASEQAAQRRSKSDLVARLVGLARQREEEDIEYWRTASDEERGRALYNLLLTVNAIGNYPEKPERFPGFPSKKAATTKM